MTFLRLALIGGVLTILIGPAAAADIVAPQSDGPSAEEYREMGFYLRGDLGWSFLQWSGDDNAVDVGGGIGYQFNPFLRSDVRVDWSGNYDVAPGASVDMTTVMGNLYLDLPNDTILTPYVGAGAGYGWTMGEGNADKNGFAYSLMAGVSIDLSRSTSLDLGYRYREILDGSGDPKDHSVLGGVRFRF
jgi:opacity protein-like surface antigen